MHALCEFVRTRVYVCMYVCMCVCLRAGMSVRACVCVSVCVCVCGCMCVRACVCTLLHHIRCSGVHGAVLEALLWLFPVC